jgi:hypothetical protein
LSKRLCIFSTIGLIRSKPGVRDRVRSFIQAMIEGELDETLMRRRYGRRSASSSGKNEAAVAGTAIAHDH